jgi:hypothetical protein
MAGREKATATSASSRPPPMARARTMPDAADHRQHHRFGEELAQDVALAGAGGHADADFAGALAHGHQHDVHHADAAHQQRDRGNRAEHQRQVFWVRASAWISAALLVSSKSCLPLWRWRSRWSMACSVWCTRRSLGGDGVFGVALPNRRMAAAE